MCTSQQPNNGPAPDSIHALKVNPLEIAQRAPTDSEKDFFKRSKIPGYAADDNKIVMSPEDLPGVNKEAVKKNEALRIFIRETKPELPDLTPEQKDMISKNPVYGKADSYNQRATVLGRLASGDPSGGKASKEQNEFLRAVKDKYRIKE